MGHLAGKDIYRRLGAKIDNLAVRAPWNDVLYEILTRLYTADEAELVVKMPYGLSTLERIVRVTAFPEAKASKLLDSLCGKGLVMDIWLDGEFRYTPSPFVVGIFEFTMMRAGGDLKRVAELFGAYMKEGDGFLKANFGSGEQVSIMRSLPYGEAVAEEDYLEVLDYERAEALVRDADRFAVGICSCRHEKEHTGGRECSVPLETCTTLGMGADYLIRHGIGREISREEMLDIMARSREAGLVLNADNVRRNITFICHCCGCCCGPLLGISTYGYPNSVVTSTCIAEVDEASCTGCGRCVAACPIRAVSLGPREGARPLARIDEQICLGCGVCALKCSPRCLRLKKRERRVIHPETTFQRIMLQSLERGTLQNQLFDEPDRIDHRFMRAVIGGFLKLPPVKRALMGERLRSRFLQEMEKGAAKHGPASVIDL